MYDTALPRARPLAHDDRPLSQGPKARARPEEAALARAAARGDDRAFARLAARYRRPLLSLVAHMPGDPRDVEDIVQDALLAAWRALPLYDPERPFSAWLFRIAANKARDHARKRAVRAFYFTAAPLPADERLALAAPDPDPATAAQRRDALRHLARHIDSLPETLRRAFTLRVLEGVSQREAARRLGTTAKAVELRVYRARKLLRERVAEAA